MIEPDDAEVLGCGTATPKRRPGAVSQILRKISAELMNDTGGWDLLSETDARSYRILVASSREQRQRAYALAYRVYSACGYVADASHRVVLDHDADPDTITLLVQDESGGDAATISIAFDHGTLPADATYHGQIQTLRDAGRQIGEVTRLAIAPEHQRSKSILLRLINFVYVYARRVKSCDDLLIEVAPRHAGYYSRFLKFEQFGPALPCPRVQNAIGVLLRLEFMRTDPLISRYAGKGAAANSKTLYPYFYSWFEEGAICEFMARQQHPMTDADREYFGLAAVPAAAAEITGK